MVKSPLDMLRRTDAETELLAAIAARIIEQADYLSTELSSGIRIDSWIEGFTEDEMQLIRRLHRDVY